ncbi:hypothetical protein SAY86_018632 [Trapa natans]|uniref:Myb-like domain-containing protein n=1 Tax=Trapa natans TaxID=22666 RepID=A0AAN7QY89_TRANT|nr:hypothetical protein SAY86_018632 [Trapa natans]
MSNTAATIVNTTGTWNYQTYRKPRRCWSQELHRKFLDALQTLGGSQVATPRQIMELMKDEGLTNDEVKGHLQKYRLHNRPPSTSRSPQAVSGPAPVIGGISDYATAAAAAAAHGGTPALDSSIPAGHATPDYSIPAQEIHTTAGPTPTPPHGHSESSSGKSGGDDNGR